MANIDNLPFSCEYCGDRFKQKMNLRMHQNNKRVGMKYKCRLGDCVSRTFICKQQKYDHVESFHPSNQPEIPKYSWKCSECSFVATTSGALKIHSSFHKSKYRCDQCLHWFETLTLLTSHKDSHHKQACLNPCSKSASEFGTREDFREHQSQMGNFKCLLCDEEFECEHTRSQHLEKDHEKDIKHRAELATLQQESSKFETFECDHCGLSFDKKLELINHMLNHLKFICCNECGSIFTSLKRLTIHRRLYSGNFKCKKINCNKKFKCKRALNIHIGKDHVEIWKCPECLKVFKTKKTLRNHHNEQHNAKFQCDLCELSFFRKRMLLHHKWKSHEKEIDISQYSCDECGKIFRTRGSLHKHKVLTEHQIFQSQCDESSESESLPEICEAEEKFLCDNCGLSFEEKTDLITHMRTHENPGNDTTVVNYQCLQCDLSLPDMHSLTIHLDEHDALFSCDKCGQEFKQHSQFLAHQKVIGKYKCFLCDKKLTCDFGRSRHVQLIHGKDFKCSKCDFVGKSLRGLKSHFYSNHKKPKPDIQIEQQPKKPKPLKGKRKFQCRRCKLNFVGRNWKKRLLKHHRGCKPKIPCDKCGKQCKNQSDLSEHQKHIGKHKCIVCDKAFVCDYAKVRHIPLVHGQDLKCLICGFVGMDLISLKHHCSVHHRPLPRAAPSRRPRPSRYHLQVKSRGIQQHHNAPLNATFPPQPAEVSSDKNDQVLKKFHKSAFNYKTFRCEVCDQKFFLEYNLLIHLRLHMNLPSKNPTSEAPSSTQAQHPPVDVRDALQFHNYCKTIPATASTRENVNSHPFSEQAMPETINYDSSELIGQIKQEPEVSYVLKLPADEGSLESDTVTTSMDSISHIKQEPEVSYILKLPPSYE